MTPFCSTVALPDDPFATSAITWVSLQLSTTPFSVPSHTCPDEDKYDYPTQKPMELMRRPILSHLRRGELVYEPFLGSEHN
jgi:DNA modification methylase